MTRKEARERAFILIFEHEFRKNETLDEIIESAEGYFGNEVGEFTYSLVDTAISHEEELDKLIDAYSVNWKKNRISKVNLAALRLALGEIFYFADTPDSVAINEAVEIVKKYGGEEEKVFVNGILGGIVKKERGIEALEGVEKEEENREE